MARPRPVRRGSVRHRLPTRRCKLVEAWEKDEDGVHAFDAIGLAYVRFALANPSHYRVMFGGFVRAGEHGLTPAKEASGAFQALVDALTALQKERRVRRDDPLTLARFVWATVHGVAMLGIDGPLGGKPAEALALARFVNERLFSGIGVDS